jgi:hypothetical protein
MDHVTPAKLAEEVASPCLLAYYCRRALKIILGKIIIIQAEETKVATVNRRYFAPMILL